MARHESKKTVKASVLLGRMQSDIKSLNSGILIITQKMKYLVRNEKILGRNLIVLNKKIRALEDKIASGQIGPGGAGGIQTEEFREKLEDFNRKISDLQSDIDTLRETTASKEDIKEMRYVVESINPLQFVTLEQVKDIVNGKQSKKKKVAP